jgi:hypothetical protein
MEPLISMAEDNIRGALAGMKTWDTADPLVKQPFIRALLKDAFPMTRAHLRSHWVWYLTGYMACTKRSLDIIGLKVDD